MTTAEQERLAEAALKAIAWHLSQDDIGNATRVLDEYADDITRDTSVGA